ALFLIISTPVKDVQQAAYTASILPHELLSRTATDVASKINQAIRTEKPESFMPLKVVSDVFMI
ncbi:hypothetical protein LJC38_04950, partial [Parabacteroides sp. OttesenSCG-928-K15]|nr:hypothetical protein [Parabacteroides sp. OttesenSCG-928-K15]